MISRDREEFEEVTIFEERLTASGVKYALSNDMTLFCSVPGYGKTLAVEKTKHEYYRNGFTVIDLTDVKLNFETCYAMLPEEVIPEFHKYKVEFQGSQVQRMPLKIYHPFTFRMPVKALPQINFFTIPIKSLRREHFSFLSESHTSSETVKLMLNAVDRLKTNEGLFKYMRLINELIEDKTSVYRGKKVKKINKDFFTTSTTSGTKKDVQQIQSYFLPFKKDYFLSDDLSKYKINFRELLNDQKHYHCLTYKWIIDEKMRYFTILCFLLGINENLDYARHPVCIIIDEIRDLVPDKATGYKDFMAEIIKRMLSTIRNKGRGVSIICGSQEFFDIEEDVRNSFTEVFLGRLAPQDIERLSKIHGWSQSVRQNITGMKKNHFYRLSEDKEYTLLFPPHAHKEPYMNFFELYHKHYPQKEQSYKQLIDKMRRHIQTETNEARKYASQKDKREKELIKKELEEKQNKSSASKKLTKIKQQKEEAKISSKEELMKRCYEIYTDPTNPKTPSFRNIAKQLGISYPTVQKYIEEYSNKKNEEESRPKIA